jgi:membrane protease YdiL (CAAX protease family)
MSENLANPLKRWWFLISRLFMLGGMMLFFSSLAYIISAYCCNWLFNVNLIEQPGLIQNFGSDPKILNAVKFLQVGLTIGMMIIPAVLFPKAIERNSKLFLQLNTPLKPLHFLIAIAIVLASTPVVSWMVEFNSQLTFPPALANWEASLKASEELANQLTRAFLSGSTPIDLTINIFVIAIIPAIAEELLFRGALQQFIKMVFGNIHIAIFFTAIIFSAFHGQIYGFLPRFALGILLGYLFVYSGSIWTSILAHFVNNAISVCISHFKLDEQTLSIFNEQYHFNSIWVAASTIACILLVIALYKTRAHHAASVD